MYSVINKKNNGEVEELLINGFALGSSKKKYTINGIEIKKISVVDPALATPIATDVVMKKYKKLVEYVTNVLIDDDDDDGESIREALNHIEKFRLEIKNKYRDFLKRKELEMMAKQLTLLKKELEQRQIEINEVLLNTKESRRSK